VKRNLNEAKKIIHSHGQDLVEFIVKKELVVGKNPGSIFQNVRLSMDLVEAGTQQTDQVFTLEVIHTQQDVDAGNNVWKTKTKR
jgi:hypothetical protein